MPKLATEAFSCSNLLNSRLPWFDSCAAVGDTLGAVDLELVVEKPSPDPTVSTSPPLRVSYFRRRLISI